MKIVALDINDTFYQKIMTRIMLVLFKCLIYALHMRKDINVMHFLLLVTYWF